MATKTKRRNSNRTIRSKRSKITPELSPVDVYRCWCCETEKSDIHSNRFQDRMGMKICGSCCDKLDKARNRPKTKKAFYRNHTSRMDRWAKRFERDNPEFRALLLPINQENSTLQETRWGAMSSCSSARKWEYETALIEKRICPKTGNITNTEQMYQRFDYTTTES